LSRSNLHHVLRWLTVIALGTTLISCLRTPERQSTLYLLSDDESSALAAGLLNSYEWLHPELVLSSTRVGRVDALNSLASGDVDAILLWMPPQDAALFSTPIGQDLLVVVTNPKNVVTNISEAQLKEILHGQVANWTELNGPDSPISIISSPMETSTELVLEENLLGNTVVSYGARLAPDSSSVITLVSSTASGIGYVPRSLTDDSVQQLSIDGVSPTLENARLRHYRYLAQVVFVSENEPSGSLREFLDWILSSSGQQIVRRYMLGFAD